MATNLVAPLSKVPLFSGLTDSELSELSGRARVQRYPAGTILFLEGDPGEVAYVVLSGRVNITLVSLDGNQLVLDRIGPGGYFGEMALLDGKPRSATGTVTVTATVVTITRDDLVGFLTAHPEAAIQLLRLSSERLRLADEKIKALGFQDVGGRLARAILSLAESSGSDGMVLVQHEELAEIIGSRRPTVTALLSRWRVAGYIETSRGHLRVLDRGALEELGEL